MLKKWETFFLMIMTLPIMGHVVILPLMYDVSGRDCWISVVLSLPFALLFVWMIYQLRRQNPEKEYLPFIQEMIGKPLAYVLNTLLMLYFLFLCSFSLAALADMTFIAFMPDTPIWALVLWALLFCLFAVFKGIKTIAQMAGILTFIALTTGHSISILDAPKKDWANILPILEFGWTPVIFGALVLISIWMELIYLLLLPLKNVQEKRLLLVWNVGIILNGFMMASTLTGAILIFGAGQVDNFSYPSLEIVRLITLGFIDRFDIYGLILMTFGCYIRGSLYFRLAFDLIFNKQTVEKKRSKRWIQYVYAALLAIPTFIFTIYLSHDHMTLERFTIYYIYGIVLLPLPLILLIISSIKRRRPAMHT